MEWLPIPEDQVPRLRSRLLRWYRRNRRDLPWRRTRGPYRIWVSEIMLQQTRVAAVLAHYKEFLRRFPDVRALARARPEAVLAAWSGLGYYRRARHLHAAARQVVREHGGTFPRKAGALIALPGVGRYTAAAIASIAFGEAEAVVDGNVERVLRRLFGWRRKNVRRKLWTVAEELLSRRHPGEFNQAMMELGATVCLPRTPLCDRCPLARWCRTRGALERRPHPPRRRRATAYALLTQGQKVLLVQRPPEASLMPGMWELPQAFAGNGRRNGGNDLLMRLRHSITATDYTVSVFRGAEARGGKWISRGRLARLPLTGLARKILRRAGVIQ